MTDEEKESKVEKAQQLLESLADSHAKAFESWLQEHKDATKEEARKRLTRTIETAIVLSQVLLITI